MADEEKKDFLVKRPGEHLWRLVKELREDQSCSHFYDLSIYCNDGTLEWNRLCLAMSHPHYRVVLVRRSDSDIAISMPDISVAELREELETSLPKIPDDESLPPAGDEVTYTLVEHKETDNEASEDETYAPDLLDNTSNEGDDECDTPIEKMIGAMEGGGYECMVCNEMSGSKREMRKHVGRVHMAVYKPMKKGYQGKERKAFMMKTEEVKLEPGVGVGGRGKRRGRKRKAQLNGDYFDEDDLDYVPDKSPAPIKVEACDTPRVVVDSSHGGTEAEDVEQHITRYMVGDKIYKECNTCSYATQRVDRLLMREHLFSHFPDITGFACPICRLPVKRKRNLMTHLEREHTEEMRVMYGIEFIQQYDLNFDSNSDEQVNLRDEDYCKMDCENCKETFYSMERVNYHIELGVCKFVEEKPVRATPGPGRKKKTKVDPDPDYLVKREPRDNLADYDSDYNPADDAGNASDYTSDEDFKMPENNRFRPVEQLSIEMNMEGLLASLLRRGGPYECVIPSCEGREYPSKATLRRHYQTHDPEMYGTLVCPICQYKKSCDRPGEMTNHIIFQHDQTLAWAKENVITDESEKLKQFKALTGTGKKRGGGLRGRKWRLPGSGRWGKGAKRGPKKNSEPKVFAKIPISLEDPDIRASFENGGAWTESGNRWFCGVPHCSESFRLAYQLKTHYWKHDKTLHKTMLECNTCPYSTHLVRTMQAHQEEQHQDIVFLGISKESQYKTVDGKRWLEFSDQANEIVRMNPNSDGREWEKDDGEYFETIDARCHVCSVVLNTQNAFEDHDKVHHPENIKFTCQHCNEGFIVESVYKNHIRSHENLYTHLKSGPIRCNGCSQHFSKVAEVKQHLMINHFNLLDNCHFCEQCSDFFTYKHSLRNHMFTHAERVYRCPVCPQKQFLTQEEQDEHLAKGVCKPKEMNHICNDCGRKFPSNSLLDVHVRKVHQNIFQFQCKLCNFLYENMPLMEKHIRQSHKVPEGSITQYFQFHTLEEAKLLDVERLNANKPKGRPGERNVDPGQYPCPYGCGGTFKKSGLTRHTKVCGRGQDDYIPPNNAITHSSNHSSSPHQFKQEVAESQNGAALDQQTAGMMVTAHDPATGKMVWQCTQCNYSNKLKFTVKEHCETHIGGITHTCPHCQKVCPTRNALRVHTIRNHSNNPPKTIEYKSQMSPTHQKTLADQQAIAVARAFGDLDNPKPKALPPPRESSSSSSSSQQQGNNQQQQQQQNKYQQPQNQHKPQPPSSSQSQSSQSSQSSSSSQSQKPRLKPPKVEYQPQPPSAHMGHTNRPLMNQPAFPGQPRGPYEDNSSQHSEDNNAQYTEELNRLLQQSQDTTRQQSQPAPYPGVPGYGLPMWPFYRQ